MCAFVTLNKRLLTYLKVKIFCIAGCGCCCWCH